MSERTSRSRHSRPAFRRRASRRGVVSVVSMMFLILFGTLAAAMAIMSRGNIVTAATHQHVSRALGAAETGLAVAERRLAEAAGRFVVEKGEIDAGFGWRLWSGQFTSSDGDVTIIAPTSYADSATTPGGVAEALAQIHTHDTTVVVVNGLTTPVLGPAPADADLELYRADYWVRTPAVALDAQASDTPRGTAFQIDYAPRANGTDVRVIVTGYDFDYGTSAGRPVTRTIMQDFRITKRVDAAVVSPSRIMIGKNVMVDGDLGAVYDSITHQYADPLVIRSDFHGLDVAMDASLTRLYGALESADVDLDNRLRLGHPAEGAAAAGVEVPDVTGDGYLDEFDVFLSHFDADGDGRVVLSAALTAGTPAEGLSPEFVDASGEPLDDDLGFLIDASSPDRNGNGVYSFVDENANGRYDAGEPLDDWDAADPDGLPAAMQPYVDMSQVPSRVYRDQVLGFRDGVIDHRDVYAKVKGKLVFRVSESDWTGAQGSYRPKIMGPIEPEEGEAPMRFSAPESELPTITGDSFTNSESALKAAADGDGRSFNRQVADSLGVSESDLATWTPANNPAGAGDPKFYPLRPDANRDALPDNWQTAYFEKMPFNSPNYADWYYRPVYENMTFRNVQIPEGTNALFRNCTFIGVTYVRSRLDNTHSNWALYGKLKLDPDTGRPEPDPVRSIYGDEVSETSFPTMLSPADRPVLMAATPLDKADIPDNETAFVQGYDNLPDPLIIDGVRVIDTKLLSNNCRFHDCLFVGSIVSDAPQTFTNSRNKLQFTGSTKFVDRHPDHPDDANYNPDPADLVEIAKSSMMLPNYSVDIGSFNSPPEQDVRLHGAVIAGVLDVRGNASIDGALLLTFRPVLGAAPLVDALGDPAGNPALFNATLGYFGPEDGDEEAMDPESLPIYNGERIVGWDLDGDGLADLPPGTMPTQSEMDAGAAPVPFHGYGHIFLRFDPNMVLPDGIMLPLRVNAQRATYHEGTQ